MQSESKLVLKIEGMDCAEEIGAIKSALADLVGGESNLIFDLLNGKLTIVGSFEPTMRNTIVRKISSLGMKAFEPLSKADSPQANPSQKNMRLILTLCGTVSLVLGFLFHWYRHGSFLEALGEGTQGHRFPIGSIVFYVLGTVMSGWFVFPKAWNSAKRLSPDMNLLMTLAVLGAMFINEWLEAATVSFLFSVSLLLESWSIERARRATKALLDLAPNVTRLLSLEGHEKIVPSSEVKIGESFIVKPGERFPLDGTVLKGTSEVNQAPITGESLPVSKSTGDTVYAGTINGNGAVIVRSTKTSEKTTLAHIIQLIGEAHSQRSQQEQWVERFAKIYTPVVIGIALLIVIIPPLIFSLPWFDWIYRALTLLVIACPCALVISTPVSIVAALASAARNGVLIKGGKFVELPGKIKAIAFDKTGTLTKGNLNVSGIYPLNHHTEEEFLSITASLESHSEHPIASAILNEAAKRNINFERIENYQTVQGKGATAFIKNEFYWLGSHRYLEEWKQETPELHKKLNALTQGGHTVVVVGNKSHICGFVSLSDEVRPESKLLVNSLRDLGVNTIAMLTGDNHGTATEVAKVSGVNLVYSELLPADKVRKVEELTKEFSVVAMVGDGINDAPAMARASLGIAMGAAGSDAAIESADIALMSDDLTKIPWLICHSRRSMAIIKQNISFALAVKGIFVALTFLGYSSLWGAIAADMGASLIVIFNGLRLLKPIEK